MAKHPENQREKEKTWWWTKKLAKELKRKKIVVQKVAEVWKIGRPGDIYQRQNTVVKQLVAEAEKEYSQKWFRDLTKNQNRHKLFRLAKQKKMIKRMQLEQSSINVMENSDL